MRNSLLKGWCLHGYIYYILDYCVQPSHVQLSSSSSFASDLLRCSESPGSASGPESGALQLSPVDPVEGTSVARLTGDRAKLVSGKTDRNEKKLNPKIKGVSAPFRFGTL